jgi:glyoxylase-like metal-dependent hydrolase (beta-lactamase superfamily II)
MLREIASGVHFLAVGKGLLRSNVYFVRSDACWVLVDAAAGKQESTIRDAAATLFGEGRPPACILLTHDHPDHAGSARALAGSWDCPVYVHPAELALAVGDMSTFSRFANPLDRWFILPFMRLLGSERREAIVAAASLEGVVRPFEPDAELPGLPDWRPIPTPGHTPGHVAYFRPSDGTLLTGDALLTAELNSPRGLLPGRAPQVCGPPWYVTWDRRRARDSVALLARLGPWVLAGGHGEPMVGPQVAAAVRAFAESY